MAGPVPAIHADPLAATDADDTQPHRVDARNKPGHDGFSLEKRWTSCDPQEPI